MARVMPYMRKALKKDLIQWYYSDKLVSSCQRGHGLDQIQGVYSESYQVSLQKQVDHTCRTKV